MSFHFSTFFHPDFKDQRQLFELTGEMISFFRFWRKGESSPETKKDAGVGLGHRRRYCSSAFRLHYPASFFSRLALVIEKDQFVNLPVDGSTWANCTKATCASPSEFCACIASLLFADFASSWCGRSIRCLDAVEPLSVCLRLGFMARDRALRGLVARGRLSSGCAGCPPAGSVAGLRCARCMAVRVRRGRGLLLVYVSGASTRTPPKRTKWKRGGSQH